MTEANRPAENRREPTRKGSPDWEQIHRRLATARAAAEKGWQPPLEKCQRILRQRARELAREPMAREESGEFIDVVEFLVANEHYGVESHFVREVFLVKDLAALPCVPTYVLGVINIRGKIVSVVDFRRFFELPEKGLTGLNKAVIVSAAEMELGVLADAVVGSRRIPARELQPSLPTLTEIRAEYLKGVSGERLVVLDAEKILSDPKLVVHQQVGL